MADPNITLMGATYPSVSGVTLPKAGGGTATFPWVEGSETKTENGTYDVTRLAEVVVNVPNSGLYYVTPEEYGAVGDGTTDDSQAVQDACDAGYAVYFASNKTYYIPTAIDIDHDIHLFGGENTVIKTETQNGSLNDIFVVSGTLKKTTTLTTDYASAGNISVNSANAGNRFTLVDMTGINAGDIMVVKAEDQYYSYARPYYYKGMTLLIGDKDTNHLYTTESIPYDITLTNDVSVRVYNAPTVIIESLNFVADRDSIGNYKYFVVLDSCKGSIIRNCTFAEMDCGVKINHCVNTLIDNIFMRDGKNDNTLSGDGYGIHLMASTNTIIQRFNSIVAQTPITTGGDVTVVNTFVRNCDLTAQCRPNGIGMHENSYNIVVEDCVMGGLNILGTGIVNRCRFIQNNRLASSADGGITFCGSHDPKFAMLKVSNCNFESASGVYVYSPTPQNPIQSFDCIVGQIDISDCTGGRITFDGTTSETILSNRINELRMVRWTNCVELYRPRTQDIIGKLTVSDCTFSKRYWVNDHNDSHAIVLTGIEDLDYTNSIPMMHKISADKTTYGEKYLLPENTMIQLSSNNASAKFIVVGRNLVSNNADDYYVGTVSGNEGAALTRTPSTGSSVPAVSINSNGDVVYTQKNNTSTYNFYPLGMAYVQEPSTVTISATLKNTGATSAATFRAMIAIVDCATGLITYRGWGTAVEATAAGATVTHTRAVPSNSVVLCYFYCSSAVANAETTFEDYTVNIASVFAPASIPSGEEFTAVRRTGDGSVSSLGGVNNIMCSETQFTVKLAADYIGSAGQSLLNASGVSF